MKGKRVIVTGGNGFVGTHLVSALVEEGATVFAPPREIYDLRTRWACETLFDHFPDPDCVLHLAATVGGIGANTRLPAKFLSDNILMNVNMVDATRKLGGGAKFVGLGSVCGYPETPPKIPFLEDHLWDGYPEPTNAPYGLTKRLLLAHIQASIKQYGFRGIYLIPTNLYGPGDNFHPQHSHVIPALIRKVWEAMEKGKDYVTVWGTGHASRDFLHVRDLCRALLIATDEYEGSLPINLGAGVEVPITTVVRIIMDVSGFEGRPIYDTSKPDGQPRRVLDIRRARKLLGWAPEISLEDGIKETWDWWTERREDHALYRI